MSKILEEYDSQLKIAKEEITTSNYTIKKLRECISKNEEEITTYITMRKIIEDNITARNKNIKNDKSFIEACEESIRRNQSIIEKTKNTLPKNPEQIGDFIKQFKATFYNLRYRNSLPILKENIVHYYMRQTCEFTGIHYHGIAVLQGLKAHLPNETSEVIAQEDYDNWTLFKTFSHNLFYYHGYYEQICRILCELPLNSVIIIDSVIQSCEEFHEYCHERETHTNNPPKCKCKYHK